MDDHNPQFELKTGLYCDIVNGIVTDSSIDEKLSFRGQSLNENFTAPLQYATNKNVSICQPVVPLGEKNNTYNTSSMTDSIQGSVLQGNAKAVISEFPKLGRTTQCWMKKGEVSDEVIEEITYLKTMYVNNRCLICGFCSKSKRATTSGKQGWKHVLVHRVTKPYKCDKCDKSFINNERLLSHSIIHENNYPFCCSICKKQFRRKKDWSMHFERMHTDVRVAQYNCSVCSKAFTSRSEVRRHYRTHTGEKLHFCNECNQGFTKYDCLQTHMNKHRGIRPYKCDECSKNFFNKKYLKHHMNLHSKGTTFECKVCHMSFNFKSNLSQHMKTHSEERSHGCDICGKMFKLPHHLRQHLTTHGMAATKGHVIPEHKEVLEVVQQNIDV